MLSFLHYTTELWFQWFGLRDEMDTCFLHSMLHFTFALKKDFIEIWFNKIFLSKIVDFLWEINRLD